MANNEQPRLLLQHEDETNNVTSEVSGPPWQRVVSETVPVVSQSSQERAEFAAHLQRLADTMTHARSSRLGAVEAVSWTVTFLCLFFWGNLPLSLVLGLLAVLAGKYKNLEARYVQSQSALDLAQYNVEWLAPLALALESPRPAVRPVAAQLLLRILPAMTAEDFARLAAYERSCLYRRLIPNEEIDVMLAQAILDALEHVGNAETLRYVERLAYGLAPNAERRRLRSYAEVCMARMQERLQREAQESSEVLAPEPLNKLTHDAEITPQERWAVTQVEAQLKLLEEEKRKRQQPGMRVGFLIASWCVIVPYCAVQTWQKLIEGSWGEALVLGLTTGLATQLHRFCLSTRQTEAARKLAQHDDVRGVGPLAEALEWPDPDVQSVAMRALTRLLPRMQATDGALLNAGQRANLYRRLNSYQARFQPDFQMAILKALEQIGDEAAIPYVQRLANSVVLTRPQHQVRQAAQDCLPYLRTRAEQRRISQTLLRASSATETTPDMLLRPADTSISSAPEQLLRATTDEV